MSAPRAPFGEGEEPRDAFGHRVGAAHQRGPGAKPVAQRVLAARGWAGEHLAEIAFGLRPFAQAHLPNCLLVILGNV